MEDSTETVVIKGDVFKLPSLLISSLKSELLMMQDYSLSSKERYEVLKKLDASISNYVQSMVGMLDNEKIFACRGQELSMPASLANILASKNDYDSAVKQLSRSIKLFLEIYNNEIKEKRKTL